MAKVQHDGHVVDTLIRTLPIGKTRPRAAADLRRVINRLFNPGKPPGPRQTTRSLHHYLGAEALQGFLSTIGGSGRPRLWASLATHLNDHEELLHGQAIVWRELKKFRKRNKDARGYFADLKTDLGLDWAKELNPEVPWTNIFVASLTERGDALGMWRGYTDQRGYALTFEISDWPKTVFLARVVYDDDVSRLPETFTELLRFYRGLNPRRELKEKRKALFGALKRALGLVAAVYKAHKWSEEKEWRLVQWCEQTSPKSGEKHIQFRVRRGRLIPFHEIALPEELVIKKITFGPGYHAPTEKRALTMISEAYLPGVKVEGTEVPLRID